MAMRLLLSGVVLVALATGCTSSGGSTTALPRPATVRAPLPETEVAVRLLARHVRGPVLLPGTSAVNGTVRVRGLPGAGAKVFKVLGEGQRSITLPAGHYQVSATVADGRCEPAALQVGAAATALTLSCTVGLSTD